MNIQEDFLQERRKEEYQMQHFGFSSATLKNEVKEMAMAVIEDAAGAMEKSLLDKFPANKNEEIRSATKMLVEEYASKTEEWISSIEVKLDNHFLHIPSNILLADDKPQIKQYTKEEVRKTEQEIKALEKKLMKAKFMEAKLKEAVKLSEKALKHHSKFPVENPGTVTNDLIKGLEKIQRKLIKVGEDTSNCLEQSQTKNNSSLDISEEKSIKEESQLVADRFKTEVH